MVNQVAPVKEIGKDPSFFASVAMKSPWAIKIWDIHSLFMAVCEGFGKTLHKTPSKKGPFAEGIPLGLLVRFLWANKENEQDHRLKGLIAK